MQVRLCQVMAGPSGVREKGETIQVTSEQGADMILRGLAIAVEPSPLATVAAAVTGAIAAAPAQLAAPFRRKEHGGRR